MVATTRLQVTIFRLKYFVASFYPRSFRKMTMDVEISGKKTPFTEF
jgi:hypothetical protein